MNNSVGSEIGGIRFRALVAQPLLAAIFLLGAGAVTAQVDDGAAQGEEAVEMIVVTGSRIVRRDLNAPSPVVTLSEDDIKYDGQVTLEQTLNEYPQLQPSNGTSQTNAQGGAGVLSANLRALGSNRTLVLVNGRRFLAADTDGVTDLATIPDALVESVGILTGGASAVYGSDAVAGAVNFTLKDDFEGIELKTHFGETAESDAGTVKVDLTFGTNLDNGRGNVVVSGSYTDADPAFFADRGFAATQLIEVDTNGDGETDSLQPGGSGVIPGTSFSLTQSQRNQLVGVDFAPTNRPCTTVVGVRFGPNGEPLATCFNEDRYNFSPVNYLSRPRERWQISALGQYDVSNRVTAYTELFYIDNSQAFQQAPDAFSPRTPGAGPGQFIIPDLANNPVIPQATRDFFIANAGFFDADGDGNYTIVNPSKRAEELGPRNVAFDRNSRSLTAGLKGDFDILGTWYWDTSYTVQRTTQLNRSENLIANRNLNAGLDVVVDPVSGAASCGEVAIRLFPNCVPVNIFGTNSLTPEMADFLTPVRFASTSLDRQIATASIAGDLFELPAGAIGSAFGVEWRSDEFAFNPDDIIANDGVTPNPPNAGDFDVFEVFGELRIPVFEDVPLVRSLIVELAGRHSDYSTIGGVTTWRAGADWTIVDGLRVRSTASRAIRAPSLVELFASRTRGFSNGDDPCDVDNNPSQAQQNLCVLQGVPAADIATFQQISPGVFSIGGGNPGLDEEVADTYTVGVVYQAGFLDGLNIAVDYYNIEIESAIASIGAQTVIDECFRTLDPSGQLCGFITRLSDGQLFEVEASLANVARETVSGLDLQADYVFDTPRLGLFNSDASIALKWYAGWQFERERIAIEGAPPLDCAGLFGPGCSGTGVPIVLDFQSTLNATYRTGPLAISAQMRVLGDVDLREGQSGFVDRIGREQYFDLNARFDVTDRIELFGGINNVTDNDPPLIGFRLGGPPNTNTGTYDLLGRRFYAGARVIF